jgi:hypothetical protein
MKLSRAELGSVLVGLRLLQQYYDDAQDTLPPELDAIATDDGEVEALDSDAIDDLCEYINSEVELDEETEDEAEGDEDAEGPYIAG